MDQPYSKHEAKKLLRKILTNGFITYSRPHAIDRLKERNLTMVDCENVLRGGIVEEAEYENGSWRHQVRTNKIAVIIEFLSKEEVLIVTAWRLE
ncbi:MAG: DUF4258 domain-containing protein [Deltaproteobacteria bacterium]|nr:DUF4258 domain-containing protein [Deltaproteobacteria bacterium]